MSKNLNGHEKPVNRMAAFSYAKGVEYKSDSNFETKRWKNQPKTFPFPGDKKEDNLTGFKYSRLTVIGYFKSKKKNKNGCLWVVRCSCGMYEVRRTRTIKNHDPQKLYCCMECQDYEWKKRHYEYSKLGYNKDDQ